MDAVRGLLSCLPSRDVMVLFAPVAASLSIVEEEGKTVLFIVSPENSNTIIDLKASGSSIGDARLSMAMLVLVVIMFARIACILYRMVSVNIMKCVSIVICVVIVCAPVAVSLRCNQRRLIKFLSLISDASAVGPAD